MEFTNWQVAMIVVVTLYFWIAVKCWLLLRRDTWAILKEKLVLHWPRHPFQLVLFSGIWFGIITWQALFWPHSLFCTKD